MSNALPEMKLSCSIVAHILAFIAFVGCAFLEAVMIWEITVSIMRDRPWQEWVGVAGGGVIFPCFFIGILCYYLFRLAVTLEFGEKVCISTVLAKREADWSELARFELLDTNRFKPIEITLTDGSHFAIWTSVTESEAALNFVRAKPWAMNWQGCPLERMWSVTAIMLGLFIVAAGIVIAMLANENKNSFLVAGFVVGFFAISYGFFHLIWRPIYYRPVVGRSSENAFKGNGT